jgi:hypothetical protein
MWIPESEDEIRKAIEDGDLVETATFDAKEALPKKGKSKDLAVDVAAMANDGSVLLYGVGEDEQGLPSILRPFELSGAPERVDQIVRSSVSEPPAIEVRRIPSTKGEGLGYLVVVVPPSQRAPHMVIVGNDYRYYGRSATGNMPLNEGAVARLYERRQRWEVEREDLLDKEISRAPLPPQADYAHLHLVARPVVPDQELLDRAAGDNDTRLFLSDLRDFAGAPEVFSAKYSPDLAGGYAFERGADGWVLSMGTDDLGQFERSDPALVLRIHQDGSGHLFCGRAAQRHEGSLRIFEVIIAGLTTRFLAVLGKLHAAGGYLGSGRCRVGGHGAPWRCL